MRRFVNLISWLTVLAVAGIVTPQMARATGVDDGWSSGDSSYPLTVLAVNQTSATLTWPKLGRHHAARIVAEGTGASVNETLFDRNVWTTPNYLAPGTTYLVQVRDASSRTRATPVARFTTAPAAPTEVGVTATATSVSVTWAAVRGATHYLVDVSGHSLIATATTVTVAGLADRTHYSIGVTALNNHTGGTSTTAVMTTTPVPSELTVTRRTRTSIAIRWASVTGATSYGVSINGHPTTYSTTGTSLTVGDLKPATAYVVTVNANTSGFPAGTSSIHASTARVKPKVKITATKKAKKIKITRAVPATTIRVQVRQGRNWRTVTRAKANEAGTARLKVKTRAKVRVVVLATATTARVVRSR